MIKRYTLFGERRSGTNFVNEVLFRNFAWTFTSDFGHKHFFGFSDFKDSDDVLFVGLVRDPYAWISSFIRSPYCLNAHLKRNCGQKQVNVFLNDPFWSVWDHPLHGDRMGHEIMEDRHIHTGKRYKNIFESRSVKVNFLQHEMPKRVKHYVLLKYEDVRDHNKEVLEDLRKQFHLPVRTGYPVPQTPHRNPNTEFRIQKEVFYAHTDFDVKTETSLGYVEFQKFRKAAT